MLNTQENNYQQYHEKIQALTNCNEHLIFIENIVQNNLITESKKSQIFQLIEQIKSRIRAEKLSLAVVGEFSSGKSTFINALLRDDLLKTSALVTTAVATKITSGQDLIIEATLDGEKKGVLKTNSTSTNISVPFLNIHDVTPSQLIHLLTVQEDIARDITDLKIYHPANFLQEGINIIDTPGTNAINLEHGKITRDVIENVADVAVIVIPATTPLSQTLATFLNTALRPFLHRCVFVVTKMDCIRKRERESLAKNLKHRIETILEITNFDLWAVSPQTIIDSFDEDEISASTVKWISKFTNLEHFLRTKLRREKLIIIAESLLRLLTKTLEELKINLTEKQNKYQQTQLVLEENIIQDLKSFTKAKKEQYRPKLGQAISNVNNQIDRFVHEQNQNYSQIIHQQIMAVSDWDELNNVIENHVEPLLNSCQNIIEQKLADELLVLNKFAQSNQDNFDRDFIEVYQKLEALKSNFNTIDNLSQHSTSAMIPQVIQDVKKTIYRQESQAESRVYKGGAIGIIVGTALLPGIGTVIGGIAGGYLSRLWGPSLAERKTELWNQLKVDLNSYFPQINRQLRQQLNDVNKKLLIQLENHIDLYMDKYQTAVNLILNEQEIELNRLQILQGNTNNCLREIERRKQKIEQQTNRLIKMIEV